MIYKLFPCNYTERQYSTVQYKYLYSAVVYQGSLQARFVIFGHWTSTFRMHLLSTRTACGLIRSRKPFHVEGPATLNDCSVKMERFRGIHNDPTWFEISGVAIARILGLCKRFWGQELSLDIRYIYIYIYIYIYVYIYIFIYLFMLVVVTVVKVVTSRRCGNCTHL